MKLMRSLNTLFARLTGIHPARQPERMVHLTGSFHEIRNLPVAPARADAKTAPAWYGIASQIHAPR